MMSTGRNVYVREKENEKWTHTYSHCLLLCLLFLPLSPSLYLALSCASHESLAKNAAVAVAAASFQLQLGLCIMRGMSSVIPMSRIPGPGA